MAVALLLGVAGWRARAHEPGPTSIGAGSEFTAPVKEPDPPSETTVSPSRTTAANVRLRRELSKGASGDDVKMVQQRLYDLGFDPGGVDGVFGASTIQAVWAFEKLAMGTPPDKVTGHVTSAMWDRMEQPLDLKPRRANATSTHVEVYLPEQALIVFKDKKPILITHISTGSNQDWCEVVKVDKEDGTQEEKGVCGKSITPGGIYYFNRRQAGWWEGELGRLWNPVYFNYGIAVHGAGNVPSYPASHGCVRIPLHIGNYFPTLVKSGDEVFVFDGVKEPEAYGAQPPYFDRPDPNYTTTTSTTTTSTTTTSPPTTRPVSPPTTRPVPPPTSSPTTAASKIAGSTTVPTVVAAAEVETTTPRPRS